LRRYVSSAVFFGMLVRTFPRTTSGTRWPGHYLRVGPRGGCELNRRSRIVVDTLLPSGTHPSLPGATEAGVEEFLDEFRRSASPLLRLGLRAGMFLAVWIAPVMIGRVPPITLYRRATRERALEALAGTRVHAVRAAFTALKVAVSLGYGADPAVRRAIGYPMPEEGSTA
jgi:hypothetical protein